ncbi:MAG: peptide deformylase [Synechococcales cyanobacterium RU_4_20]|nr:peptide deformylase [Synechococcales cyanobacterium RU_4_20]NJR68098.1 peptide deformylase [Synechococcales cyanobacterium CRU_2_2]
MENENAKEQNGKTRNILRRGEPLLRQIARPVGPELDARPFQQLIDDLIATAIATNGVGIAAPQVAASERVFVVASRPNARYPQAPHMEPTAMINPVLLDRSDAEVRDWEGCLSLPNCRAQVARAEEIWVEYWDRGGRVQRSHLQGFVARIFQHELDHLNGILFVDHVDVQDCISEAAYQKLLKQQVDNLGMGRRV